MRLGGHLSALRATSAPGVSRRPVLLGDLFRRPPADAPRTVSGARAPSSWKTVRDGRRHVSQLFSLDGQRLFRAAPGSFAAWRVLLLVAAYAERHPSSDGRYRTLPVWA